LREKEVWCHAWLEASADLERYSVGQGKPAARSREHASVELPLTPGLIEEWTKDPQAARLALDQLLHDLSRSVTAAYLTLIKWQGTTERAAESAPWWQGSTEGAAQEIKPPNTGEGQAGVWCLLNREAVSILCTYRSYGACAAAKLDEGYRCVTGD